MICSKTTFLKNTCVFEHLKYQTLHEHLTKVLKNSIVKSKHYILTCSRPVTSFGYMSSTGINFKRLKCGTCKSMERVVDEGLI